MLRLFRRVFRYKGLVAASVGTSVVMAALSFVLLGVVWPLMNLVLGEDPLGVAEEIGAADGFLETLKATFEGIMRGAFERYLPADGFHRLLILSACLFGIFVLLFVQSFFLCPLCLFHQLVGLVCLRSF